MPSTAQTTPGHSLQARTSRPVLSRLENLRGGINGMFTGHSMMARSRRRRRDPESPKTPRLALGLQNFSQTRLAIPYLTRSATPTPAPDSPISLSSRPAAPASLPSITRPVNPNVPRRQAQSANTSPPSGSRRNRSHRFVGVDPAEVHLAELANAGRRRGKHSQSGRTLRYCGPRIKNKRIRRKILSAFISGLFLTLVLTVYLALALTNRNESQEFHVLLILIILITTIFFCHSLIRLCMMIIKPPSDNDQGQQRLPDMLAVGGFANPTSPVRVALARDEEAVGDENPATKYPPPAYGLWRESVRVDPNRIFWQRRDGVPHRDNSIDGERPTTANRPPSYLSDDGVNYVVDAAPRSTVPEVEFPLPVHPSERGRVRPLL